MAIALWGLLTVLVGLSLWDLWLVALGRGPDDPPRFVGLSAFDATLLALAVLTPVWLARGHRNAETIAGAKITGSPAWTAGIWFVPLAGGLLAARALGGVWAASGAPRAFLAKAWAISWSLGQALFLVALAVAWPGYSAARRGLGGGPLSAEDEALLDAVLFQEMRGSLVALGILTVAAAFCMGLAILDLQKAQRPPSTAAHGSAPAA